MKKNRIRLSDLNLAKLWNQTRRGVLYGLVLVLFLLIQNVIMSHIGLFGVHAMFMPALVAAVALFEGGARGGYFGLAAGILCDLFFSSQTILFTVLFPVMGFVFGFMADFFMNRRFLSYCVLAVLALALAAFAQMFSLLVYKGQGSWALWRTMILQVLWSLPFIFPAYYICKIFPRKSGGDVASPY